MHEMGICLEMMETLKDVMEKEGIDAIKKIVLEAGAASMLVPRYMASCWEIARANSPFAGCELEIKTVPAHGRCASCGFVFDIAKHDRKCPSCGSYDRFIALDGQGIEITEIVAG